MLFLFSFYRWIDERIKNLIKGFGANKWQSWNSNPGNFTKMSLAFLTAKLRQLQILNFPSHSPCTVWWCILISVFLLWVDVKLVFCLSLLTHCSWTSVESTISTFFVLGWAQSLMLSGLHTYSVLILHLLNLCFPLHL